jgi:hypothetical protein
VDGFGPEAGSQIFIEYAGHADTLRSETSGS